MALTSKLSGPRATLSPTTTFILGALILIRGGWSLTGVTVMLNFSVTARLSSTLRLEAMSNGETVEDVEKE